MKEESDSARSKAVRAGLRANPAIAPDSASDAIRKLSLLDLEIVNGVVAGYSNREIARQLLTTEISVNHQLSGIFVRLEVSGRLELALFAIERWLKPETRPIAAEADDGAPVLGDSPSNLSTFTTQF